MAALVLVAPAFAQPQSPRVAGAGAGQAAARRTLSLEAGAGRVISLPSPAANVFVADPKIAEVRPASPTNLFVFGVSSGRTTVVAMDGEGHSLVEYEVTVRSSNFTASEAEAAVGRVLGSASKISVTPIPRGLLVTGSVASGGDASRALSVLKGYLAEGQTIENQLVVRGSTQVTLRVRVIEMNRNVTRALGVDWSALGSLGRFGVTAVAVPGLGVGGTSAVGSAFFGTKDIGAVIQALANDNLARLLAEPNLTVMSGQPASFLAGGEFPIPVGLSNSTNGPPTITINFKQYGVSLNFVPTVLSDGRINLHVAPEVSELTNTGAVTLSTGSGTGTNSSGGLTLQVPGLLTRRAETTVELGSGQSFAIAGLLSDQSQQTTASIPLLGELPVIGSLFRSSGFLRQETELVFIVTPYIVAPVSDPGALHTPGENFALPTDLERILMLRQVGSSPAMTATRIPGQAGFIVQ